MLYEASSIIIISHKKPILKQFKLLKVEDLFHFKILKCLYKLAHNELLPILKYTNRIDVNNQPL